jgi:quinol monooxygenase YgiN/catechol 2,3-dioxygenase-like lactoylglutathione lyase family enzyme
MITCVATQRVRPGQEMELERLMSDLTRQVRASEPGCLGFDWVRSTDTPGEYLVIERYADDAALAAHQATPYLHTFLPHLLGCLTGPPAVARYAEALPPIAPRPESYFHVGVVVPDLDKAVARFADVLGVRFTEPATFHVPRLEDPRPHPADLVCAFSMTRPPYYELIQAAGDGIVSAGHAGQIFYFGCWEPDMAGRLDRLRREGVGVDALFRMDAESPPFAMITAPDLLGARIEYVDLSDRGPIEEWVRTGRYPGGVGPDRG